MKQQVEQFKAQLQAEMGNLKARRAATAEQLDALNSAIQQQLGAILACEHLLTQAPVEEQVEGVPNAQD